jgi:hypothetical protein
MSNEALGGPWQMTRTGVIVPVRGALLLPTPKGAAPQAQRAAGRVEGPAEPIAARRAQTRLPRSNAR